MRIWRVVLAFLVVVAVSVFVVGSPIQIGSVESLERMVVAHLIAKALEAHGYEVTISTYSTSQEVRSALRQGSLDLCVEYTGTVWMGLLSNSFSGESPQMIYSLLEEHDDQLGLIWMDPIWCNSTYAVAVTAEFAAENNVYGLKAFGEYVASMSGEVPFSNRFDFLDMTDLQTAYNFEFAPGFILHFDDFGTLVTQMAMGNVVGWTVAGTDPAIARNDWVLLSDENQLEIQLPAEIQTRTENPFADLPTMDELQRRYIRFVLDKCGGRIGGGGGAAEVLGLKRTSLYSRMKILGMKINKLNRNFRKSSS